MKKNVIPLFIHFKQIYNCSYFYVSFEFLQENVFVVDHIYLTNSVIEIIINNIIYL